MLRILVTGGRKWGYYENSNIENLAVTQCLYRILNVALKTHPNMMLIQGGAKGADFFAKEWGKEHLDLNRNITFFADWKTYGKRARVIRNQKMLDEGNPKLVIACPGGPGTAHMVKIAAEKKIPIKHIISY